MQLRRIKWLDDVVCDHISNFYDFCEFTDGSNTGPKNRAIKRNVEMIDKDMKATSLLMDQFHKHPFMQALTLRHVSVPLFAEYRSEEKGHYSFHNDAPIMHDLRTDHLFITAINDESEYEGGDLIIRWGTENISFRLQKGEGILIDPNLWHTVTPVTKGKRRVCIMWFESMIRDTIIRELYFDYVDLCHRTIQCIDPEKWNKVSDIDVATYFNGIKYKILREYGDAYPGKHSPDGDVTVQLDDKSYE